MAKLLAASGRRADHVAVYRRLHESDARSRPPRALRPAVTWDDFAFTVECFKGADCVCSTTASFPRAGRQQTFGTSLVTPPVPRPDRDDALAFLEEQRQTVLALSKKFSRSRIAVSFTLEIENMQIDDLETDRPPTIARVRMLPSAPARVPKEVI